VEAFTETLDRDPLLLRELRHSLASWLDGAGASGADRDSMVLATHEAAAQAIQNADSGTVDVSARHDGDHSFVVHVRSDRAWSVIAPNEPGSNLLTELMSEVSTRMSTTVRMRKET
jgi:hypothetical protein